MACTVIRRNEYRKRLKHHRSVDGTNMKSTLTATVMTSMKNIAIIARLFRSLRTKGSRMRDQFMNVYSLYPAHARRGSSLYTKQRRKYVPSAKGSMTWRVLVDGEKTRFKRHT